MTWSKDSGVWHEALDKARQEISDELLAQNLALAKASNNQLMDRVENGDYRLVKDKLVRVPMDGKNLAITSGIKEDKARVGMGQATNITGKSQSMAELAEQFRELYRENKKQVAREKKIANSIEGECEVVE